MDALWIKIVILVVIGYALYRQMIRSAVQQKSTIQSKATFSTLLGVGAVVGIFVYAGMSVTLIQTRDLRSIAPKYSPQLVSIYDPGVIEVGDMIIKTNLAPKGTLNSIARTLTSQCHGNETCEIQSMFDFVTRIPYKTDHTSRAPSDVLASNWGDCDDKTNLFASLLEEKGYRYALVYVPRHVFVAVQMNDPSDFSWLKARIVIDGKNYYYAETTAKNAKIGEFNGQFPNSYLGIYDLQRHKEIDLNTVSFRLI